MMLKLFGFRGVDKENEEKEQEKKEKEKESEAKEDKKPGTASSETTTSSRSSVNAQLRISIEKEFTAPEGEYRLLNEISHIPIDTSTLRPYKKVRPTRISFIVSKENSETTTDEQQATSSTKKKPKEILSEKEPKSKKEEVEISKEPVLFFLYSYGDAISLARYKNTPLRSGERPKYLEPTLRFRHTPSCHDFNKVTSSNKQLELVVGFTSGDILYHDPLHKSFATHMNRERVISQGAVNSIVWIPGSRNLFIAAYSNGCLFLFDKNREDQPFNEPINNPNGFFVYHNKNEKANPVSRWYISKSSVTDIAFSPDSQYLAATSTDGYLRVFHYESERFLLACRSNYGGFSSVCWSPDCKYMATGGEDDNISIWSFKDKRMVAAGQGHTSWITRISFDPWNCSNGVYRIGSTGQDCKLLLWDFREDENWKPKMRRDSDTKLFISRKPMTLDENSNSNGHAKEVSKPIVIKAPSLSEVMLLEPVVVHMAHTEPISELCFLEDTIATSCWGGMSRFWIRPSHLERL